MSCSAWAWVTASVTSVPAWLDEVELEPPGADVVEVLVLPPDDIPTDSTVARCSTTRVLMVPPVCVCAPAHPGCPVIGLPGLKPTVSNTATSDPACTAPATASGRQKLSV